MNGGFEEAFEGSFPAWCKGGLLFWELNQGAALVGSRYALWSLRRAFGLWEWMLCFNSTHIPRDFFNIYNRGI